MKEILITSSVMIAALLLLRLVFAKKVSRTLIYGVWILVALRLLVPVQIGQLDFSVLTAAQPVTEVLTEMVETPLKQVSQEDAYADIVMDYIEKDQSVFVPEVQVQIEEELRQGSISQEELLGKIQQAHPEQDIFVPAVQQQVQQQMADAAQPVTLGQIATVVWLAGVAAMAVWFAAVNLRYDRALRLHRQRLSCDSPIPVYVSDQVDSPCLVGPFRPVVYVTRACAEDPQMLRHVLTHELTHYAHRDHIWSLVRCVCLCAYWFDPLVWAAAACCRRDCELACDEGALKRLAKEEHLAYGQTLLDVVRQANAPGKLMHTATSMNESKKQLKERIHFIVKRPKVSLLAAISMVLVCAIVASCVAAGPAAAKSTAVQTKTYMGLQSVDNKLAIVHNDTLFLTKYNYHSGISLDVSLDGKAAVCHAGALLYIHDGTVENLADKAKSYSFSVSGNSIAFLIEEESTGQEDGESSLYLYQKESGRITQVVSAADGQIQDYTLSPDGQTLAYILLHQGQSSLMLYQNGSSTVRLQFENNNGYRLVSIDNSTDIIYLRTRGSMLSRVNKAGERISIGRVDRYLTEYNDPKGHLYLNADHTQLLYNGSDVGTYLSDQGREGIQVSTFGMLPVESTQAPFLYGKNAVTCGVEDMKDQLMQSGSVQSGRIQFLRCDESGQYVALAQCQTQKSDYRLDPSGQQVYYVDKDRKLYGLALQSGAESILLADAADCYAISYDGTTLHYASRYLYEYKDGLQKYGSYLYTCDAADGSVLGSIQTEVVKDMFFSEDNQLFCLLGNDGHSDLYTLTSEGNAELVLEDVVTFARSDCGVLYVATAEEYYVIRAGQLIRLQIKTLA